MEKYLRKLLSKSLRQADRGFRKLEKEKDLDISPRELHLELTYLCNSKCIMCDLWPQYHQNPQLRKEELTLKEIKNFVEKSNYLKKLELVLFTGGEPFLREDIVDICGYFIQKFPSISVGILTNCFNTRLTLNKLKEIIDTCAPKDLWMGSSLDGLNDKHDEIRGIGGSFKALVKTLDIVKRELPRIKISLNFTLTTRNYRELLSSFRFAKERGFGFSAQFAVPWKGVEKFAWDKERLLEISQQVEKIMEEIVRNYRTKSAPDYLSRPLNLGLLSNLCYWNGLVAYQEGPRRLVRYCTAGRRFAMFNPFGDLYFCPLLKHSIIGNIKKNDFDTLWTSKEAHKIRDFIDKEQCHCWLSCTFFANVTKALSKEQSKIEKNLVTAGRFLRNIYSSIVDHN